MQQKSLLLALCSAIVSTVTAQQSVSLLIPGGFDSVPLTADVAGVGASGETTWIVRASQSLDDQGGHPGGTATLVQGPAGATFTYTAPTEAPIPPGFTIDVKCSFTGANAICTEEVPNGVSSGTIAIEEGLVPVALGTTLAGAQVTTTGGSTPTTTAGTGASVSRQTTSPAGSSQTGASNPSPTSGSSALTSTISLSALLLMTLGAAFVV